MEINVKYLPGQKVWAINKYPAGAKVWETEVEETIINISIKKGTRIMYRLNDGFKILLTENQLFDSEEEALLAKEEWCSRPEVKKRNEHHYTAKIEETLFES